LRSKEAFGCCAVSAGVWHKSDLLCQNIQDFRTGYHRRNQEKPLPASDEIFGISFRTADRIAKSLGIDPYSKYRISSGIKYVLSRAATEGHTFLEEEMLKSYTSKLWTSTLTALKTLSFSLVLNKSVYVDRNDGMSKIYLSSFYHAELEYAESWWNFPR